MSIYFTKVTWYSQVVAIILFVGVFYLGMNLGTTKEAAQSDLAVKSLAAKGIIAAASYSCSANRYISALYYKNGVRLIMSDGREYNIPQVISASGARYANADESFVFWNKGNTAFTMEGDRLAWDGCVSK